MHFELELLVRTLLISFSRPSDLMNRNEKQMKLEPVHLTKAQRCEIIAKLRKSNAPSKQALGWEYEVSESTI